MKAGAVDFLTKTVGAQEFLDTIVHAVERDRVRHQLEAQFILLQNRYRLLDPRERLLLSGGASGLLNKQIASAIGSSETTVEFHRGQLMRKMKADSLADLVWMAAKLGVFIAPQATDLHDQ
jgi:FixJ family two-component response regulator